MRIFSYRNKQRARRLGITLAVLLAVLLVFCLCRFIYLQRYLVYGQDGVRLDFSQDLQSNKKPPSQSADSQEFPIEFVTEEDTAPTISTDGPMEPLSGYYISTSMLRDLPAVQEALAAAEAPKALMFEMKSIFGNFYYNSVTPGAMAASVDTVAIESMIEGLEEDGTVYLIARIPAFCDNNFALSHQYAGLPLRSGALWMDDNGCYWLDPMEDEVQVYLISIAQELATMGFDEIVFDGFAMPTSSNIVYNSDLTRDEATVQAAEAIRAGLETTPIRVSFNSEKAEVAAVTDRVYLSADDGSAVAGLVAGFVEALEDPAAQTVFLTASRDTRFDGYGILRPLIEAPIEE